MVSEKPRLYWIEVEFSNGKTLRKECSSINETYTVFNRYSQTNRQPQVKRIRAGRNSVVTGEWIMLNEYIV